VLNTTTLDITDGSSDLTGLTNAARNLIIELTGTITGNQVVTVPDSVEKSYIIKNNTTGTFTVEFKTATGTGFTFATTDKGTRLAYADGTNVVDVNAAFTTISQFTLPTADGTADQALITDASGNLSFSGPFATNGKAIAFAIVF
jgi:trimeric autotransporter adhesin